MKNISKGFIYAFLAALAWAGSIIFIKLTLHGGENLYNAIFWSAVISSPFWLLIFLRHSGEAKKLNKKDVGILLSMVAVSAIGVTIVEFLALRYTQAINYSFLIRAVIPFTFVFAFFILGEKITIKKIFLTAILLAGAYLLATNGSVLTLSIGDLLTLLEAMLIALGNNTLGKLASGRMSTNLNTSAIFLIGFLPILVITWWLGNISWPKNIWPILFIAIFNILVAQFRFTAYKNTSASVVTMIFSFTPVFVSILAIPLLGESLSPVQITGGLLIVIAGILVEILKI